MTGNHALGIKPCGEVTKPAAICKDPWTAASRNLAILGASARAAAYSARRAGLLPSAADLFGDRDLAEIANWTAIRDYPLGAVEAASRLPPGPWIYTGGLENYPELIDQIAAARPAGERCGVSPPVQPELIDQIAAARPLLGNPGEVLRAVRDPLRLAACLRQNGLDAPDVSRERPGSTDSLQWLRKPLRSGGGHGIDRLSMSPDLPTSTLADDDHYYQRFVDGVGCSASFVAAGGKATLIGVTCQLVGEPWTGAAPFMYCGSLWPVSIDSQAAAVLPRIGDCLAAKFWLTGLFGVDLVICGQRAFVIEVNPRYPASIEVLEQSLGGQSSAIQMHIAACCEGVLPQDIVTYTKRSYGKAILFARQTTRLGSRFEDFVAKIDDGSCWSPVADIPVAGAEEIPSGQPVLTVRAAAASPGAVLRQLQELARKVRAVLEPI
jgi:uncharacterized protein